MLVASLLVAFAAACGAPPDAPIAVENAALGNGYDHQFWRDTNFPGSTDYSGWYDSDLPWGRGSYVRLPVDAQYIGNWSTATSCSGGGTQYMNSPEFSATVNGTTRKFVFNHMIQNQFFIPTTHDNQWYNGGTLIGLTGGSLCNEGYPTHSSGNHFCNEVQGDDPYHYWNGTTTWSSSTWLPDYESGNCSGSNGSSGVANPICPICGGRKCPPYSWCGSSGQCCTGCAPGCPC
jgi:hypothetical protein